jgi:putative holliday junction resolvase
MLATLQAKNCNTNMARILSIDYGGKRTGIAVTDPMQIIASGLTTVDTKDIWTFLKNYFSTEPVEKVIIGLPTHADGNDTHATPLVRAFLAKFKKDFPLLPIETVDEMYTSKMAVQSMVASGMKKKDRQNKKLVDEIAATIMLQEYMQSGKW